MLSDLEGCHLLLSCMDHDKLSNDDAIGSASLSLGDVYKMHVEEAGKPCVTSSPTTPSLTHIHTFWCVVNSGTLMVALCSRNTGATKHPISAPLEAVLC